jgi:ATP-dependent DNA helicase RecG
VVGVDVSARKLAEIEAILHQGLSPPALVSVESQEVEGKQLLVVEVPAGQDVPYAFKDVFYLREGERTRKADVDTLRDLLLRKQVKQERWERRFSLAEPEDIDADELSKAINAISRARGCKV